MKAELPSSLTTEQRERCINQAMEVTWIKQSMETGKSILVSDLDGQNARAIETETYRKSSRPMRWMEPEHIAAQRRLPDMEIGEVLTLAERYHPRHGLKTETIIRLA